MRLVCDKCGAAYLLDEALIPPKGAKAQCPKCRHLQLVQRPERAPKVEAPSVPRAAPTAPPAKSGTGRRPTQPSPGSREWLDDLLNTPAAAPKGSAPAARPSAAAEAPRSAPTAPEAPDPPAPKRATPAPASPRPGKARDRCSDCDKPLSTPFDQALGLCAECRLTLPGRPKSTPSPLGLEPTPSAPPIPFDSLSEPGAAAEPSFPPARVPRRGRKSGAFAASLGALVALGALGAAIHLWRARVPGPVEPAAPPADFAAAAISEWRARYPSISLREPELLAQGQALLQEDRHQAYAEALALFEQALVLNPRSDDAAAGYVEALALGRGEALGEEQYESALAIVEAARQRSPRSVPVALALGDLLLTRRQGQKPSERAVALADQALNEAGGMHSAEVHLLKGRAYLGGAGARALAELNLALEASEGLKRAYYYRALAYEAVGEYGHALEDLERRLAMDSDCPEALWELGRLYKDVGEVGKAHKAYEEAHQRHPDDARAVLALAALRYQAEGKPQEAVALLKPLVKAHGGLDAEARRDASVHLVAAMRLAGGAQELGAVAASALESAPDDVGVRLQLLLAAVAEGKARAAAAEWAHVKGKLKDAGLESVLAGRVALLQGDEAAAAGAFIQALSADPQRLDAALWLAVIQGKQGDRTAALATLSQASSMDPAHVLARPGLTVYYLLPAETLKGVAAAAAALSPDDQDALARVLQGAGLYYQHNLNGAATALKRILKADAHNALAHAYASLVELEAGGARAARREAELAVEGDQSLALAHYALGASLLGQDPERAQQQLAEAVRLAPRLFAAELSLAKLEAKKSPEAAKARLLSVIRLEPGYVPAMRALYALGEKG